MRKARRARSPKQGGDSWFFLTSDYAFGHSLQKDASQFVEQSGGKVLGAVRFPFGSPDFSSFLLQAQASKAKVIGLAMSGADLLSAIKQAREFGIVQSGQRLASLVIYINDIEGLGLDVAQGLTLTTSFYWDTQRGDPRLDQAVHGALGRLHSESDHRWHLRLRTALSESRSGRRARTRARRSPPKCGKCRSTISTTRTFEIRADGRVLHKTYLMKVKSPSESKYRGDFYQVLAEMSGEQSFRPLSESECPLVGNK